MSSGPTRAAYYRPAEVAAMLRCSEWWVKEQARRRRIPYAWIGGSYLFTEDHITEIVRLFEVRPVASRPVVVPRQSRARNEGATGEALMLRARRPRRSRDAAGSTSAAA